MVAFLIAAAVNIGIGLLLNALFPPPETEIFGPRQGDLSFTGGATYGAFVNIIFGTDRVAGNIIDTTDPAIEEVVTVHEEKFGTFFGFGGSVLRTTSYTYFLTCRIGWAIEGAQDLIRLWGDGKTIIDKSAGASTLQAGGIIGVASNALGLTMDGVEHTFYPGGKDQVQDSEEVSRRDSNIPAYRHLTTLKLDRFPLANFGNRIPQFTAEIAFASSVSIPILNMVEPAGLDVPGSLGGGGTSYMSFNPSTNALYSLKNTATGVWAADAGDLTFRHIIGSDGFSQPVVGHDGFYYGQTGAANSGPLEKRDIETGEVLGTFGASGIGLTDDTTRFGNSGEWWQLNIPIPGVGSQSVIFHMNFFGNSNGSVVDEPLLPLPEGFATPVVHVFSDTDDGLPANVFNGTGIPDHDRGRFFMFIVNTANDTYDLVKVVPNFKGFGAGRILLSSVTVTTIKQFTRGTFAAGDDFEGTGDPEGWAINRLNSDLILSNDSCTVLYNPDSDTILAQEINTRFRGRNNYYTGDIIAYGITNVSNGTIRVLDTRTLKIVRDVKTDDIPWPNSEVDGAIHERSCVWDDRTQALFISRVELGSGAATNFRILKLFVNRLLAEGVGLDTVVSALSTKYQRQTMAGLDAADIDVTTLAGETVIGYTVQSRSTMKQALQPLRSRFLFDGLQSDWIMKFPIRGAVSTVTIPEQDVGLLRRGRDQTDEPAVKEIRQDDLSLPMSLNIRYRNRNTDYQTDVEGDKRHIFPDPTMHSKNERTLDIPIVDVPANMKPLVQKHLLTMWNERVSYKTIIPWTYLALDATDVFKMGVFGETAQLRMAELDLGLNWSLELTGVVEDTKSFTSTLTGVNGLGHVNKAVPSSLPTRLFALDAPLLSTDDFQSFFVSNAYMVVAAYEDSWPGATIMKSFNGVTYLPTGTVNVQAAIARVKTVPTHWGYIEGDFPNRFQDVADGGTLVITPLRRADAWASAADEIIVLAGANMIGVIHDDTGEVEILSFQNVTVNDDNTIDLTKLLRGRFGTEDIADKDINIGDTIVLLSNATNVRETGPILSQRIAFTELDIEAFFAGVTIGSLLDNTPIIKATYTGRDLRPFSVVHTTAVNNAGDIDVDWERRTRGPLAGEWDDGTGEVSLNETIEQYTVIITDGTDSVTKTVDDVTLVTFTAAELSAAGVSGASTVTIEQVSDSTLKSPITPSSTASVTV